jgi:hypothetical protein
MAENTTNQAEAAMASSTSSNPYVLLSDDWKVWQAGYETGRIDRSRGKWLLRPEDCKVWAAGYLAGNR